MFKVNSTHSGFSADAGAWGAGSGTINAQGNPNGFVSNSFWGIANWDSDDSDCGRIYQAGVVAGFGSETKSYLYYATSPPTALLPPTIVPSREPTAHPTLTPTVSSVQLLFAVVGGTSCAENLYFGPQEISTAGSADGLHEYFLSTSTPGKDTAHTDWLQIVTGDGTTELFRIYWTFTGGAKTLAQRFIGAVSTGEAVNYRVVDASTGLEYMYSGIWWFSSSASITTSTFDVATTQCCFSVDDGAWGAGSGVIDGNGIGYSAAAFWGIGNWNSYDSWDCYKVFRAGMGSTAYLSGTKAYMYYTGSTLPTTDPTTAPTSPTVVPSEAPTATPTMAPTLGFQVPPSMELFSVIGGKSCSENLPYGPQEISTAGSTDGAHPYFLSTGTASKDVAHRFWLQVVTSDGSTELFRIYWTFDTPRTLAQHFSVAVSTGEAVSFRVVEAGTGQEYLNNGIWWFSSAAGNMASKFNTVTTRSYFSSDDGVWGAGNGTIDGISRNFAAVSFWGIGNWGRGDPSECFKVYKAGVASSLYGNGVKSYVYYSATPAPTLTPTTAPSNPTTMPSRVPTQLPSSKPTSLPSDALLFAVVGGSSCAESLFYGPQEITTAGSEDGLREYFLSTITSARYVPHTEWLQIVTSDGTTELFRIHWTFTGGAKTLAQRFIDATTKGEDVTYRVVDADFSEYSYNGTWWFSDTASITAAKFSAVTTLYGFSADDGVWGAGSGIINGNSVNYAGTSFWGLGNWDNSDSYDCAKVYSKGVRTFQGAGVKSYMYYIATPSPVVAPTVSPTPVPANNLELFAIVGGSYCAEHLAYGPESISPVGASSGNHPYYFSTATPYKDVPHTTWLQIVTSDGITEVFRIYWTFTGPAKTLAQRFLDAVQYGEEVTYQVVYNGFSYEYYGDWWFSNFAVITDSTFSGTSGYLSKDDGAWGAATGSVNGNGPYPSDFWGVGNFDSSDPNQCPAIFVNGVPSTAYGSNTKTFMYYAVDLDVPTPMPTPPPQVTFNAQQTIEGISYADYLGDSYQTELVLKMAIADSMTGVTTNDLYDFIVSDASVQTLNRKLLSDPTPDGILANAGTTSASPPELTDPAETSVPLVTPNLRRSNPRPMAAGAAIQTSYTVQVPYAGLTYADLSAQLVSAVETGAFTTQLRTHAEQQGVPALANATATSIETQEVVTDGDSGSDSGGGVTPNTIVGIAVGAVVGSFFLVAIVLYIVYGSASSDTASAAGTGAAETTSQQPPPAVVDPTIAKDVDSYFYGSGGTATEQALIPTAPPHNVAQDHNLGVELSSLSSNRLAPPPTAPPTPPPPGRGAYLSQAHYEKQEQHQGKQSIKGDSASPSAPSSGSTHAAPTAASAPVAPVAPAVAVSLPVAALASPVNYGYYNGGGGSGEIAIAEVYVGELEEHKES